MSVARKEDGCEKPATRSESEIFTSALSQIKGKDRFLIIAKPSARETKITAWDEANSALKVDVAAPAEDNKANLEVIKFFSRLLKQRVEIVSGLTSKRKLLKLIQP